MRGIVYIGLSAGAFVELKIAEVIYVMKNKLGLASEGCTERRELWSPDRLHEAPKLIHHLQLVRSTYSISVSPSK